MKTILAAASLAALAFASAVHAFFIPHDLPLHEYVNEVTGHYVLLDDIEAGQVANGSAGPGWAPTGHKFVEPDQGLTSGLIPVCRFYSPTNNSHFFTANAAECEGLKNPASGWIYEKIPFSVAGVGPTCAAGQVPIYRLYNNRHAFRDANHRFTPDAATRDQMIAAGWVDEGVAWCAMSGRVEPIKRYLVVTSTVGDASQCESRAGSCLRVGQLPVMTNVLRSFLPPLFVNRNPDYPVDAGTITGAGFQDLHTAQPAGDAARILNHSFVQAYLPDTQFFGIHINSADRTSGAYASIDPMYELPGTAAAGGVDERLFPFKGFRHHTLVASFAALVPTLKRADASSHAYGNLILQFADARSGRSFYVTVQAYGTVSPADFVAPDAITGLPIVSTSFRGDPAFGARIEGSFQSCGGGGSCIDNMTRYAFRMIDADMAQAITRARTIDPALSTDPADYFVAQFRVHNETYGNAELGATISEPILSVYY